MAKDLDEKKVRIEAQEISFVNKLSDSDQKIRDRVLKNLPKWFEKNAEAISFTEDDFEKVWKGLFYCMWMSDKLLPQEECAERIAAVVHMPTFSYSLLFFKSGLVTLIREWFGIDHLRVGKFLMLTRRLLRQMLVVIKNNNWSRGAIQGFSEVIKSTIFQESVKANALGLWMHFVEIYLEELAKISQGQVTPDVVHKFLFPFINHLTKIEDNRQASHLKKFIFHYLMRQSDAGLEYDQKYEAWKQVGFPKNIEMMKKVEVEDGEQEDSDEDINLDEKPLDPRAGRVDVELPQLKFSAKVIAEELKKTKTVTDSAKPRKLIAKLIKEFESLASGNYPLGIKTLRSSKEKRGELSIKKAVNRLIKFEKKIIGFKEKPKKRKCKQENEIEPPVKKQKIDNKNRSEDSFESPSKEEESSVLKQMPKKMKKETRLIEPRKKMKNLLSNENGKLKQGKKLIKPKQMGSEDLSSVEFVFKRNSGTWYVTNTDSSPTSMTNLGVILNENLDKLSQANQIFNDLLNESSPKVEKTINDSFNESNIMENTSRLRKRKSIESPDSNEKSLVNGISKTLEVSSPSTNSPKKLSPKKITNIKVTSPKSPTTPTKTSFSLNETVKSEGDFSVTELFSNISKTGKPRTRLSLNEEFTPTKTNVIKGKNRVSLDPSLIKNPFSLRSEKKVKINTKLNKSQEVAEHFSQVRSSPAIPFDANKKPTKPVLKPSLPSPLNPFYKSLIL